MKLKQEEVPELIKFLGLEEVESLDKAKEVFETSFVKSDVMQKTVGKITGTLANTISKNLKSFGIEVSDDDFKKGKLEDVVAEKFGALSAEFEKLKSSKPAEGEEVKAWEDKYNKLKDEFGQVKQLHQITIKEFEGFKTQVQEREKKIKFDTAFENSTKSVKLDPTVNEYTVKGFKTAFFEKYKLDEDEAGNVVIKSSDGNRIKSAKKAGEFKSIEEVWDDEVKTAGLNVKNPMAGQPKTGLSAMPPQPPKENKGVRPISQRALGNFK